MSIGGDFDTVLLDVDGTLIDSNDAHARAWAQSLRDHGLDIDLDQVRRLIGMGSDKLLPALAKVGDDSALGQALGKRKKALFQGFLPELRPTAGARTLVQYLRDVGVDVVIATSAADEELEALLQRAGVSDLIPKRTSKDDAAESKPAPDILEAALAKSDAQPSRSLMIGDTPYDIEAAKRAGIEAIALRCGGFWPDSALGGALDIFDHPAALVAHWKATRPQS